MCLYSLRHFGRSGLHPHGHTLKLAKASVLRAPLHSSVRPFLALRASFEAVRPPSKKPCVLPSPLVLNPIPNRAHLPFTHAHPLPAMCASQIRTCPPVNRLRPMPHLCVPPPCRARLPNPCMPPSSVVRTSPSAVLARVPNRACLPLTVVCPLPTVHAPFLSCAPPFHPCAPLISIHALTSFVHTP
jgi:hypothetical protein